MAQIRNLTWPPIQEAVIDFMVDGAELSEGEVRALADQLRAKDDWSTEEIRQIETTFDLADPSKVSHSNAFEGMRTKSSDDKVILQIRTSRITVSLVKSYGRWEDLQELALSALAAFISKAGEASISRVGTRFINVLRIQDDQMAMLQRPPEAALPGAHVTDFVERHAMRHESASLSANLAIATVMHKFDEDPAPLRALLVDIEAYEEGRFASGDSLENVLDRLRNAKNAIFFGALTDKALEHMS